MWQRRLVKDVPTLRTPKEVFQEQALLRKIYPYNSYP
jgi:hypothetical protein